MKSLRINQKTWDRMVISAWERNWKMSNVIHHFAEKVLQLERAEWRVQRDRIAAMGIRHLPPDWAGFTNPGPWLSRACPKFVEAYINRENKDDRYVDFDVLGWTEFDYKVDPNKLVNDCNTGVRTSTRRARLRGNVIAGFLHHTGKPRSHWERVK